MKAPRMFFAWIEVVVGVAAWILIVPVASLLGAVFARLAHLPGSGATINASEMPLNVGLPDASQGIGSARARATHRRKAA